MVIGVTGGVGTGKSTILEILGKDYGARLIEADKVGHQVMQPGQETYTQIITNFGKSILNSDSTINRKILGDIVFKDPKKLEILNAIIHPAVRKEILKQIDEIRAEAPNALIIIEAALLIEAGYREICDQLWYVYSDFGSRKKRLMDSRNYSEEKVKEIVARQLTDQEYRDGTDIIIDNSGGLEETRAQIGKILEHI